MASSLTMISAISSTVVIFLHSAEKLYKVLNGMKQFFLSKRVIGLLLSFVWFGIITMALTMNFMNLSSHDDTCFLVSFNAKAVTGKSYKPVEYVVFAVLVLILVALSGIVINNIVLLHNIVTTRKQSGRCANSQEKTVIWRTLLASLANFLSWLVVVPVAGMSLAGSEVQFVTLAFASLIGFPLNSIMNPIIYTFTTPAFSRSVFLNEFDKKISMKRGATIWTKTQ